MRLLRTCSLVSGPRCWWPLLLGPGLLLGGMLASWWYSGTTLGLAMSEGLMPGMEGWAGACVLGCLLGSVVPGALLGGASLRAAAGREEGAWGAAVVAVGRGEVRSIVSDGLAPDG